MTRRIFFAPGPRQPDRRVHPSRGRARPPGGDRARDHAQTASLLHARRSIPMLSRPCPTLACATSTAVERELAELGRPATGDPGRARLDAADRCGPLVVGCARGGSRRSPSARSRTSSSRRSSWLRPPDEPSCEPPACRAGSWTRPPRCLGGRVMPSCSTRRRWRSSTCPCRRRSRSSSSIPGSLRALEGTGYAMRKRELEEGHPARLRHVESEAERVYAVVRALRDDDRARARTALPRGPREPARRSRGDDARAGLDRRRRLCRGVRSPLG